MAVHTLAIDTSGSFCSVALRTAEGDVSSISSSGDGDHFEQLPKIVARLCEERGLSPRDLGTIRIGVGPGSFTGLRIGMSFAKGLAWSLQIPLVGVCSFSGVAQAVFEREPNVTRVIVVADARRDEVFAASFTRAAAGSAEQGPVIVPISELSATPWSDGSSTLAWVTPQRDFVLSGLPLVSESGAGRGLLSLPGPHSEGGTVTEIAVLEPSYLRAVAAKTIEERKQGT